MKHAITVNGFVHGVHEIVCQCGLEFRHLVITGECGGGWCVAQQASLLHEQGAAGRRGACNGISLDGIGGPPGKFHCGGCVMMPAKGGV